MKELIYSGNTIHSNAELSELIGALDTRVFSDVYSKITVEYFDGIKMDCDALKWSENGHTIMSTCKDLKVTVYKLKKK